MIGDQLSRTKCNGGGLKDMVMSAGFNREAFSFSLPSPAPDTQLALDLGGSLVKCAYIAKRKEQNQAENEAEVNMVTFNIDDIEECLTYIHDTVMRSNDITSSDVRTTGVGCIKYQDRINSKFGINVKHDSEEMLHSVRGMDALWRLLPSEQLLYEGSEVGDVTFQTSLANSGLTPCLFVNLGSAMTIVKVNKDATSAEIAGGSTMCGLSFLGLGAMLTKAKSFQELIDLAEDGDHKKVDLLVGDTAGGSYNGAPPDSLVSSFGKAAKAAVSGKALDFREADIASSVLYAVTDSLAQSIFLVAKCEGIQRVCFSGSYLSGNKRILSQIKEKFLIGKLYLNFEIQCVFLRHEAYLGAVGTLLETALPNMSNKQTTSSSSSSSHRNSVIASQLQTEHC